jgi:hypothetical protein
MNDGTPLGVRVQEAFMAAVLIGPTTKTTTTAMLRSVMQRRYLPVPYIKQSPKTLNIYCVNIRYNFDFTVSFNSNNYRVEG